MATPDSTHTIRVPASTGQLAKVRNFVAEHAAVLGFDKEKIDDIRLAVDEAFTNIIKHAYQHDNEQSVRITLHYNTEVFNISLFDTGQSFSLDDYVEPDVKEKIKQKKRGGVGVYLIRQLMDEVSYLHEGAVNEIRMKKTR